MKIPKPIVLTTSSGITTALGVFWQNSVQIMLPWLAVVVSAVIADLASGHYKAGRLGVHFAWSTAFRETAGKFVVYAAFVMTAALFDVAVNGNATVAKWMCVLVASVEIGSVLSNILICHGIKLSLKAIIKFILKKSPFGIDDEAADEIIKTARREDIKWNKPKSRKFKESEESLYAFDRVEFDKVVGSHYDEETGKIVYDHNL